MMLYSLKDCKAASFNLPFAKVNDQLAVRDVRIAVNSPERSPLSACPEDFELWCLGDFNETTGEVVSDVRFVVNLREVKE